MRHHIKKTKEGLVPRYDTQGELLVAQAKSKEAKLTMKHFKHKAGIRRPLSS